MAWYYGPECQKSIAEDGCNISADLDRYGPVAIIRDPVSGHLFESVSRIYLASSLAFATRFVPSFLAERGPPPKPRLHLQLLYKARRLRCRQHTRGTLDAKRSAKLRRPPAIWASPSACLTLLGLLHTVGTGLPSRARTSARPSTRPQRLPSCTWRVLSNY